MRRVTTVLLTTILLAAPARGQTIEKAALDQVKDATVFIRAKAGRLEWSGSGFVVKTTGDTALVMTNRHVAMPDEAEVPKGAKTEVSVVFHSGTPRQQEVPAQVLAYGEREIRDLAVLEVKGVRTPPKPIAATESDVEASFFETMAVYALGFPLGGQVQQIVGNRSTNPAITVTALSISSLRRDEGSRLARVQLSGPLIEGSSGGPIVDGKGNLIGVAVSRVRGEAVGFAVPPSVIAEFLHGEVDGLAAELLAPEGGKAPVKLSVRVVDPLGRVRAVAVRYALATAASRAPGPDPQGNWPLLESAANVPLTVERGNASGRITVPFVTPDDHKLLVQFVLTDASGRHTPGKPMALNLPDRPGKLAEAQSTALGDGDVVTNLPARVEDYAVARAGACLVLKLHGQKGLTVYDVRSSDLKTIALPTSDFAFGAGGNTAVVFLKESNEIQSWSLKTLSLIKAKEFADPVNVNRVVMGHSRDDLALLRVSRGTEALSQAVNQVLNVTTLSIVRPKGSGPSMATGHNSSFRDYVHHRATGDLGRITEWASSHTPSGIGVYMLGPDGELRSRYSHTSAGYLAMGDDGLIYSGAGVVYDPVGAAAGPFADIPSVRKVEGMSVIPGLGGIFFLGVDDHGNLEVFQSGSTAPESLGVLGKFPGWVLPQPANNARPRGAKEPPGMLNPFEQNPLTLDKRILFAPAEECLVFLPQSGDRLIRRPFQLRPFLNSTGKDYLLVKNRPPLRVNAGQAWTYTVDAMARHEPITFRLLRAPEGMTLSPGGVLNWKAPAGIAGRAHVAVVIGDAKSNKIRQTFTIRLDDPEPAKD